MTEKKPDETKSQPKTGDKKEDPKSPQKEIIIPREEIKILPTPDLGSE